MRARAEEIGVTLPSAGLGVGVGRTGVAIKKPLHLRAAELVLFAPVDPYFNLYANLPVTEEGIELEEAYAVTTALPAGWQVKGGKFKSNFSRLSAQHPHAWDFADAVSRLPGVGQVVLGTLRYPER